jgi:hypothetical protein
MRAPPKPLRHALLALAWGTGAVALGGVFMAYLNPHLMADLANRVWACF